MKAELSSRLFCYFQSTLYHSVQNPRRGRVRIPKINPLPEERVGGSECKRGTRRNYGAAAAPFQQTETYSAAILQNGSMAGRLREGKSSRKNDGI